MVSRTCPFELGIPARIFGAAVSAAGELLYAVVTCSLGGCTVRAGADDDITVLEEASVLADMDTVVIPPSHALGTICEDGRLPDDLRTELERVRPGTRMVVICTGAFVLAAASICTAR
ncbi:hypothetical protein ACFWIY_12170 [Streptomyces sioyaensis]|uniref:hypothetical protein n=1 Tax=Streptomyces sioyaensis TaxID=67364 RepID=UPI0036688F4B